MRGPFNRRQVSRYRLDPAVVDVIGFCTKDPGPMLRYMDLLRDYGQYWYVTITSYGRDIEPNVPDKRHVIESFKRLSGLIGPKRLGWRYDPVFISEKYTVSHHLRAFDEMARSLEGYTDTVVISFIDLYQKVRRNFPQVREVGEADKDLLGRRMTEIAGERGMTLRPCAEGNGLARYGADCSGCMTTAIYERATGKRLKVPAVKPARTGCACYLSRDIGAYDTCGHLCRYCYANNDARKVAANMKRHDPASPFLIGGYEADDIIHDVPQESWIDPQVSIFDGGDGYKR